MKTFFSFSFGPQDSALVNDVDRLLASHLVKAVTGRNLGGGQLPDEVKRKIDDCETLVALLTQHGAANGQTSQWVRDEVTYARAKDKRAIVLVEAGIEVGGMFAANEFIPLDRQNPLEALLRLSETIGLWRDELGRTVKVQVMPPALARKLGQTALRLECRYRTIRAGKPSPWSETQPIAEAGGTFIHVPGVGDEQLIQLEVREDGKSWSSVATSQWMTVQLKLNGGAR